MASVSLFYAIYLPLIVLFFSWSCTDYSDLRKRFYDKAAELEDNYICYYSDREHTFDALFDEKIPKAVYETVDAAKQFKLMQCDFKTETVKSKVEELAKKLLGRIFELHNHARRKSSIPRFILSIVGTPIIALFGLAFSIPGILFALAVLYFVWSSFVKSVKKKKLYNIEADKNRAELDEFEKLFIIKNNKLYLRN